MKYSGPGLAGRDGNSGLVRDAVDIDLVTVRRVATAIRRSDLVVRRPAPLGHERLAPSMRTRPMQRHRLRGSAGSGGAGSRTGWPPTTPQTTGGAQVKASALKAAMPEDGAGDVVAIRLQRLELHERARHALRDHGHHAGDCHEDEWQRDPHRQAGGGEAAEVDEVGA